MEFPAVRPHFLPFSDWFHQSDVYLHPAFFPLCIHIFGCSSIHVYNDAFHQLLFTFSAVLTLHSVFPVWQAKHSARFPFHEFRPACHAQQKADATSHQVQESAPVCLPALFKFFIILHRITSLCATWSSSRYYMITASDCPTNEHFRQPHFYHLNPDPHGQNSRWREFPDSQDAVRYLLPFLSGVLRLQYLLYFFAVIIQFIHHINRNITNGLSF